MTRATFFIGGALVLCASTMASAQDDGFTFEMMEGEVKDESQADYDAARDALNQERYATALQRFDDILANPKAKAFHRDAEYDAAKALYRMGLFHAALTRYAVVLDAGPTHPYFEKSREWLFFIARRMQDRRAAIELIALYTKQDDLPEKFKDEFNYQLARHYFDLSLTQGAQGVAVENAASDEKPAEEEKAADPDAFDFGEDVELKEGGEESEESEGDDFDFSDGDLGGGDDDGFDFSFGDDEPAKKKSKKKSKPSTKSKSKSKSKDKDENAGSASSKNDSKNDDKNDKGDENSSANSKTSDEEAPAPVEKTHLNENPASAEEALRRALGHASAISESFPSFAKALYLKGLIHFALGEFEPSVGAFRGVVRATHPKTGSVNNPKLREMSFFALARIHYQFEQFRYAIFYYQRIDRDSEAWLDALFEASWAHFRLGEYEKALGNLVTIQSPFFLDDYYPESHILKAITFYENCRYPEARAFLVEFQAKYSGVINELDRLLGEKRSPEELYAELTTLRAKVDGGNDDEKQSLAITARILRIVLKDKRLAQYNKALAEVENELARVTAFEAPYAGTEGATKIQTNVTERRDALLKEVGSLLQRKLEQERQALKDLASKLIRIEFEIAKQEKESLEAELRGESQAVPISDYQFSTATDDERVFWPFHGEYWRDELGTYEYTLTRGCRPPADE